MTPAARYAAAIEIIDDILSGKPVEQALLSWTRSHRFAGSKDRAAIRDIVFSAERRRMSCAAMGGGMNGRAIIRGYLCQEGVEESSIFGAGPYAPPALGPADASTRPWSELTTAEQADMPAFAWKMLQEDHGAAAFEIAQALRQRAPVWLRVNTLKTTRDAAFTHLKDAGFDPALSPICSTALEIRAQARQLAQDAFVLSGGVEFQDLSPQCSLEALEVRPGMTVLDYCAGGGGKSLALAARGAQVTAHDASPGRMKDLPTRAARAGVNIETGISPGQSFDMVVCDVPCSGSGAWRRAVDGKWRLTPERLNALIAQQRAIVAEASKFLRPGGTLAYMTCSLFHIENSAQTRFIQAKLELHEAREFTPLTASDGFYLATFRAP
ncbi:MAG: RsmB/NOP family class I SAM-dependent RNA methyltransferase [Pseudomonadota bacterium]